MLSNHTAVRIAFASSLGRRASVLTYCLATFFCVSTHAFAQAKIGQPSMDEQKLNLPMTVPERGRLFALQSENTLRESMTREYAALGQKKISFPADAHVEFSTKPLPLPPAAAYLETATICSGPRYFEEECTERYGLYCPLLQPLLSTSVFYLDALCLPVNLALTPPSCFRCLDLGKYPWAD